jgi:hypothetical protein
MGGQRVLLLLEEEIEWSTRGGAEKIGRRRMGTLLESKG